MKNIKFLSICIIFSMIINLIFPLISSAVNTIESNNATEGRTASNERNEIINNSISSENKTINENTTQNVVQNKGQNEKQNSIENTTNNNTIIEENNVVNNVITQEDAIQKYTLSPKEKQEVESGIATMSEETPELGVEYNAHVQDIGWQNKVKNGQQAGTTGKNLKVEALKINLVNNTSNINIKYKAYVEGKGWQSETKNGNAVGTTGKNLRMDAIRIWLENTDKYSVMYRTHIQDYGWQEWNYDGQISGKLGFDKKIEAIEIKIIPKKSAEMSVSYSSHVQDYGWEGEKVQTDISGTTGQNKKIEALKINLKNAASGINIKYKTYVENNGWQTWTKDGNISGTTGKNLKVYGIRIQLEGAQNYSIQYRAHIQDYGWSDWKKDGEVVGRIAENKKIEAIQIKVIKQKSNLSTSTGVEYYTYLQGTSENENKYEKDGETSGTTGQNRKMEGINIELKNAPSGAHIKYKVHVQDTGWMNWVKDGSLAGIINRGLKVEAIQIQLEGMDKYTVEYKAHVQDKGWTDWYIDGETAGTTGQNKKIEAIQIKIVPKYKRYYTGIDVSLYQKEINYDKLVATKKVDFMIANVGWYSETQKKFNVDSQFERNYKEARARNIPLGAYFFSYSTTVDEAKREAENLVKYLKESGQTKFELPIFYDIESSCQIGLTNDVRNKMAIAFCETLKSAGYKVGIYSYLNWLTNYMDMSKMPEDYAIWVAQSKYGDDGSMPDDIYKYSDTHDLWQYSSKGKIDGIEGNVDLNICYRRYF